MSSRRAVGGLGALAAAALVAALALGLAGLDPWLALRSLASGAAGDPSRIALSLGRSAPLLLAGLAVALAFRAGLWNIGAEGQLLMGAVGAAAVATRLGGELPGPVVLAVSLAGGVLLGAAWGAIAGGLRWWRSVPEVITTILLNFVALDVLSWCVQGPLRERAGRYPQTDPVPDAAALATPAFLPAGLVAGVALAAALQLLLTRSRAGLAIRAAGLNPEAARAAGLGSAAQPFRVLAVAGALAGVAGATEVLGPLRRLYEGYSPGYGYTAIAVALLGRLEPLLVVPAALLFGALQAGAERMEALAGVPAVLSYVIQALVILASVLAGRQGRREE